MTNNDKPNFRRNSAIKEEPAKKVPPKRPARREVAAVWEKSTVDDEKFLSIKITMPDGKEMWCNAFKNKFKKPGEDHKPEYIAFVDKKEPNVT